MNNKTETAYHEAGHVLCHVLDGQKIKYATIVKKSGKIGRTQGDEAYKLCREYVDAWSDEKPELTDAVTESCRQELTMYLSGTLAEKLLRGEKPERDDFLPNSSNDANQISYLLYECPFLSSDKSLKSIEKRLRENWRVVEALAKELLEKDCFSNERAREIVKAVLD